MGKLSQVEVGTTPSVCGTLLPAKKKEYSKDIRIGSKASRSARMEKLSQVEVGTTPSGLWDVATGEEKRILRGHTDRVNSVAFSPDGKTIASGSGEVFIGQDIGWDVTTRLWDVATGEEKRILKGHRGDVRSVAFSPDGKTIASGGFDGAIRLWDVANGEEKRILRHRGNINSVAFSPDGKTIAGGSGGENRPSMGCCYR